MAEKNPKIVLVKEDVNVKDFAAVTVKPANVIDAFSIMQGDFVPEPDTVQANDDGGFYVQNLTEAEVKKLKENPEVVDVVDDIDVFALQDTPSGPAEENDSVDEEYDIGSLELDPEDIEALEADPYPELGPDEEQMSPEQFALLSQIEPEIGDEIEHELELLGETDDATTEALALFRLPWEKWKEPIKCIIKCLLEQKGKAEEVTAEDVEAALRSAGVEAGTQAGILRDVVLCNLRIILAPWAWRYSRGAGVRVAVVDTGICRSHPDLRVCGGASYVPGVTSWNDDHNHGTHCAGIIAALWNRRGLVGVAPRARLYAVKVLNRAGRGKLSWILNGLIWCYRHRMHVVNLSLGSPARTHTGGCIEAYERVGRILRNRGILCVAAAGNSYHRPVGNPARCLSYMAVSAVDCRRRLAVFSSVGPQVEICAPGVKVLSTICNPRGYRRMSGTSMSAPHVTGVAALVKARHPGAHGDRIRVHLWKTARDLGTPGRDWAFGYGLVDALRAVR